jgi:sugar phosphate isomerase/epimerase
VFYDLRMERPMRPSKLGFCIFAVFLSAAVGAPGQNPPGIKWTWLSTTKGDLQEPNAGHEQTSTIVADVDLDGVNDFIVSERSMAPSVVWYRRGDEGWVKYVIETEPLHIEAGSDCHDIDGDGDQDIMMGGDWQSNRIWWWENPFPDFDPSKPWARREIKNTGGNKHHDQLFGDVDGDFRPELVFWSQNDRTLNVAEIPERPRESGVWDSNVIYNYGDDSQMEQRGTYPDFKGVNEHEGLAIIDVDGDGKNDIVGGGRWFRHIEGPTFHENVIDGSYQFSRAAAGDLIRGGRPEVVLVVGDGVAPMLMYEWREAGRDEGKKGRGTWISRELLPSVDNGHSIRLIDFDGDGNLDIWSAEMRLNGGNPDAKNRILLGDGNGIFRETAVSTGMGLHESKMADLDGDGDLDILGKPYNWETPRLDIFLQNGTGALVSKRAGAFNKSVGLELYSLRYEFQKDVPATLALIRKMGITQVEVSGYFDLSPEAFKKQLDRSGLACRSMIFGYERLRDDMAGVIREAKHFGARLVGCGWIPHEFGKFSKDDEQKASMDFNAFGRKLADAGLRFFYHPHGYEFVPLGRGTLMDAMMADTDPRFVSFQLDVFWVLYGGFDPLRLLRRYPGRFSSVHLKDLRRGAPRNGTGGAPEETSVALGTGEVNFPIILREAVQQGILHYYIEDEAKEAPAQIVKSLEYLKTLK